MDGPIAGKARNNSFILCAKTLITKEAPSKRSELLFSLWLKELVLELLDTGFLAAEAAQIVDA